MRPVHRLRVWLRLRAFQRNRRLVVCDQLLDRSRAALRLGRIELALAFVLEGGDGVWHNAGCLNLLGLIAEAHNDWSQARRLWSRSTRADRKYQPPRQNLRRYFELLEFGRSNYPVAFGDERPTAHGVSL